MSYISIPPTPLLTGAQAQGAAARAAMGVVLKWVADAQGGADAPPS